MAEQFTNIVGGFDQCEPPFCSQDFQIDVTQFECNNDVVYVSWSITDQYNRDWRASSNVIQYSLNSENFSSSQQVAVNSSGNNSYSTYFSKPGEGLLYIKVKAQINFIFIEGYPENHIPLNMDTCVDVASVAVLVGFCPQTPYDGVPVYMVKNTLPTITDDNTFYFSRGNYCWFIDKNLYDTEISISNIDYPTLAVLWDATTSIEIKNSCEACYLTLQCPSSDWTPDPLYPNDSGKDKAEIYFEYTTYNARDEVIIYGPDSPQDCTGTQVWTSTCVGTCRGYQNASDDCANRVCEDGGEGKGLYLRGPSQYLTTGCEGWISDPADDICIKQLCVTMRREQTPISIEVVAKCDGAAGTYWCAYAEGPDFTYCRCSGANDCAQAIGSSPSSSSSSSKSSSSSSSSKSSSSSSKSSSSSSKSPSSSSSSSSSSESSSSSQSSSSSSRFYNFTCAGIGSDTITIEHHASDDTLLEGESGSLHTNNGATGLIILTLPAAPANGTWFIFAVTATQQVRLEPGNGTDWIEDNSGQGAGKYKWADAKGESIILAYNGAGAWNVMGKYGIWTEGT